MRKSAFISIKGLLLVFLVANQALCNRYTGLIQNEEYFQDPENIGLNPYYKSDIMFNPQSQKSHNMFREIILPFTSRDYRYLTFYGNIFYLKSGIDPVKVYQSWLKTKYHTKYHVVQFVVCTKKNFVARVCENMNKCFVLHVELDPKRETLRAWREIKHLGKAKHIIFIRKVKHQDQITMGVFEHTSTSLENLIKHKALGEMQKINLTHDLLEMAESYMKYKIVHGDIHPSKILVQIDMNNKEPTRRAVTLKPKLYKESNLDIKLSGFKKYSKVVDRNLKKYPKKVYKDGSGVVDLTDMIIPRRAHLQRYKSGFKPFELWFHGNSIYGPASDLFALGLTIHKMAFDDEDYEFDLDCSGLPRIDCKKKYEKIEKKFKWERPEILGWERCILDVVIGLTFAVPLRRVDPRNSMKNFTKCLLQQEFIFEDPPKL